MDVSLDLVIFLKFPPGCQKGVYVKACKAVTMINNGAFRDW